MPGFLTHYIAGKALLQNLAPQIQQPIKSGEQLYNLGAQGPDFFFYYMPGHFRKRSRGVGVQMHISDLGLFLVQMAKHAKNATELNDKDIIFAYTSGFLMHYTLDAHAHPYVYAKTYNIHAPKIKNSADHRKFETSIDLAMLKLTSGKKPAAMKQWELINAAPHQLTVAATALSQAMQEIYNRNVPPKAVQKAMRHMIQITRLLHSNQGKRKRLMELVENLTIKEPLFSSMVHTTHVHDDMDYLNIKHGEWESPFEPCKFTDSFLDRYNAAVEEGIELVELLHKYVYRELPTETLSNKFGNRSLKTGLTCEKK
ncbi:MAG: zinc dependent phospholipase C family protein [Defluviitaleaceae bacterium]|nr:zinc dependent phospholipase C family protein [Defluviitaleaceae bacterium]